MVTFDVSEVRVNKRNLRTANLRTLLGKTKVEACGANSDTVVIPRMHPFVGALHHAYDDHLPLSLSPDDVWLVLAQGFATHVNENTEALRGKFVQHQGSKTLIVRRDNFVKGSPDNDWQGCFAEFSDQIEHHIGEQRGLVVANFSTTGPIEKAASEVVLMGAMKGFFDYEVHTKCGIPNVTLTGTHQDWKNIRERAEAFREYGLGWWVDKLLPVLDQFVNASRGQVDSKFWNTMYKEIDASGGTQISGWVQALFPYMVRNSYTKGIENYIPTYFQGKHGWGPTAENFPVGQAKAPFVWDYLGTRLDMVFRGGFLGVSQDPNTYTVSPTIGWTVSPGEKQ